MKQQPKAVGDGLRQPQMVVNLNGLIMRNQPKRVDKKPPDPDWMRGLFHLKTR